MPSTTVAAQPSRSPSPSASPAANSCPWGPFAPGPVTRLAISPRALESDGARAPMRTRLVGPGEELLCLDSDKSHRIDFNLNQRNELGQESCWVDPPRYRIRGDTDRIVADWLPVDDNSFILRVWVEPRGVNEATFGVEAQLDGVGRRLSDRAPARDHAPRRRDRAAVQVHLDRQRRLRAGVLPALSAAVTSRCPRPSQGW